MHLLQGEHHPCQRRVKCRGQPGSGPAGEKELLLCLPPVQSPGDPFARHGAKLNGRALPSQGEPSQQTQESSQEFGPAGPGTTSAPAFRPSLPPAEGSRCLRSAVPRTPAGTPARPAPPAPGTILPSARASAPHRQGSPQASPPPHPAPSGTGPPRSRQCRLPEGLLRSGAQETAGRGLRFLRYSSSLDLPPMTRKADRALRYRPHC